MKKNVHIKISDKGWILEKLASEIVNRLPYVSYSTEVDPSVELQYYMTYGCRQSRVSPLEIALFTHKENVPSAAAKFDAVASEVDFCIAQSLNTENIVRNVGISKVKTISPGVDLERYSPIVRIGVVGRTYHTGRKGEKLVEQVMDIPGIEWHFTGEGWPGTAQFIVEDELPAFYRSLDYILVPALIEGGPMCVLEALASGCEVIASPVGWVPQFPHIEFKLGDVNDLRRVLIQLVEKKAVLRKSVENYTWQSWADGHHELFCQLLGGNPIANEIKTESAAGNIINDEPLQINALVAVHGQEMTTSLGGPSVRAPKTVAALQKIGMEAKFISDRNFSTSDIDVVHVLNVWHPSQCEILLRQIEKNDCALVFSPIFLDLSELGFFNDRIKIILSEYNEISDVEKNLSILRTEIKLHRNKSMVEREPFPNYFIAVRRLLSFADHVILLSELERSLLKQIGVSHPSTSIVKNPVDSAIFNNADPHLFSNLIGIDSFVLCVGRIESRKNQALLALALRDTGIPLVLIGHEADGEYASLIRKWSGDNVIFAGRIESNSPMLASAFAAAKVFCLPSWSEGAPLVALEAAASGCNMVLSNRSSEEEYFGDLARYVDPANISDIRDKVVAAWNDSTSFNILRAEKLQTKMHSDHSWRNYAIQTQNAYAAALKLRDKQNSQDSIPNRKKRIFVDLTTVAHHKGPPTGITRVELCIAEAMYKAHSDEVSYIVWNSHHRKFICVDYSVVEDDSIKSLSEIESPIFNEGINEFDCDFIKGDTLLVFGSAWIRNLNYIKSLKTLKLVYGISLVTAIYDVIEYKMKFMFPAERREQFSLNCKKMLAISDKVLSCSERTKQDLIDFCLETATPLCPISVFRLGDEAFNRSPAQEIEPLSDELTSLASDNRFILYVSTLNIRKNHTQLLMLWKSLINEYGDTVPRLVLVGSIGWGGEEAIDILEQNPALKAKVLLLHDINDHSLDWLYTHCMFTVYPSRYEGWGLPVAESCRYGKFCLSSNAGSLPEVAPQFAEYIDPMDSIAWYKALEKYCFNSELLDEKANMAIQYRPTTWLTTANQVVGLVENIFSSERVPSLNIGGRVSFSLNPVPDALHCDEFTLAGWANNEVGGTWTTGHEAVIGFQLDQITDKPLSLNISAFGYAPTDEPIRVDVSINGIAAGKWVVHGVLTELRVAIPPQAVALSRNIIVTMSIENAKSPCQFGSGDMRILGLHVKSMHLVETENLSIISQALDKFESVTSENATVGPNLVWKVKNKLIRIKKLL